MKLRLFRSVAVIAASLCLACGLSRAGAQTYRNIVNMRFRTVSNGPQSALIVDVKDPNDAAAVQRAVQAQASARLLAQNALIQRELALLRRHHILKPGQPLDLNDAVILRHNGKLLLPKFAGPTRAGNELTFSIPTDASVDGHWSAATAAALQQLVNLLYPELKTILGAPGWNGTVTILNKDPRLGHADEVIGALLVILPNGSVQIWFPTFTSGFETQFLAMGQVMAQAFHGPLRIAYDAWEQGMARAATVVAARDLQPRLTGANAVNPNNGFYYTAFYDSLNQPPLGNNTFTPPTKSDQPINPTTLSGMLIPRLQMSSTAWLKCYIENPNFFTTFNTAYYTAYAANHNVANDVNALRGFARLAVPNVELQPFDTWFEQQFVLDTSVTSGPKLYAYSFPTFPTTTSQDDSGAGVYLIYYRTLLTSTGSGDEQDLSGTSNVIYWDYTFQNRLFLPTFDTVTITNGFGTVAPFFTGIGGTAPYVDKMRVAMDFPVNSNYVRVYFPTDYTGTEASPNDFSGVVVGSDGGALKVTYDGGSGPVAATVAQGAFGARGASGAVPNGFSRTRLVYTATGGQPLTYQRNTAFNNTFDVAPLFVLSAPNTNDVVTLTPKIATGIQMISLPLMPLTGDLAKLFGLNPNKTLLAQYRQDTQGTDQYLRYPSLPLYQPGYALWSNFTAADLASKTIQGHGTDNDKDVSVGLLFGWNQIGTPYITTLNVSSTSEPDLVVQYLGGDAVPLSQAITNGWVATGVIGYTPQNGYFDIANPPTTQLPKNIMEVWKGYWIRVLVTEGVTLTYSNPNNRSATPPGRSRTAPASPAPEPGSWHVALQLSDTTGHAASALFGQSPRGGDTFTPALDVASPPPFATAASPSIRFPHADWDAGAGGRGGEFLSDVRRSAARSQWDFVVGVPQPGQDYTLSWSGAAAIPRGTRLTLIDLETGTRTLMNRAASVSFRAGQNQTTRRFQIVAEPHSLGRLLISNVTALTPLSGRGPTTVTLGYELSAPAETTVEIRLGGRLVRRLAPGRAAETGVNQMVWDTRDDQGRSVSAGTYTIQITARTPEGEQTRAIVPLLLTR